VHFIQWVSHTKWESDWRNFPAQKHMQCIYKYCSSLTRNKFQFPQHQQHIWYVMFTIIQRFKSVNKIYKCILTKITLGCLWSLTNIRCRPILDIGWSGWCSKGNLSWGVAGRCWRVFSHRRCVIQYLEILWTLIFNGNTTQTMLNWTDRELLKILTPLATEIYVSTSQETEMEFLQNTNCNCIQPTKCTYTSLLKSIKHSYMFWRYSAILREHTIM
jgi:hypothetical protein